MLCYKKLLGDLEYFVQDRGCVVVPLPTLMVIVTVVDMIGTPL